MFLLYVLIELYASICQAVVGQPVYVMPDYMSLYRMLVQILVVWIKLLDYVLVRFPFLSEYYLFCALWEFE